MYVMGSNRTYKKMPKLSGTKVTKSSDNAFDLPHSCWNCNHIYIAGESVEDAACTRKCKKFPKFMEGSLTKHNCESFSPTRSFLEDNIEHLHKLLIRANKRLQDKRKEEASE